MNELEHHVEHVVDSVDWRARGGHVYVQAPPLGASRIECIRHELAVGARRERSHPGVPVAVGQRAQVQQHLLLLGPLFLWAVDVGGGRKTCSGPPARGRRQ